MQIQKLQTSFLETMFGEEKKRVSSSQTRVLQNPPCTSRKLALMTKKPSGVSNDTQRCSWASNETQCIKAYNETQ